MAYNSPYRFAMAVSAPMPLATAPQHEPHWQPSCPHTGLARPQSVAEAEAWEAFLLGLLAERDEIARKAAAEGGKKSKPGAPLPGECSLNRSVRTTYEERLPVSFEDVAGPPPDGLPPDEAPPDWADIGSNEEADSDDSDAELEMPEGYTLEAASELEQMLVDSKLKLAKETGQQEEYVSVPPLSEPARAPGSLILL